jgi:RimJ/RimL family protein N-acetyltransferase
MYQHRDKITLRKIIEGDLNALADLKNESWWGTHKTSFVNMVDQRAWYESIPSNTLCMMLMSFKDTVGMVIYSDIDSISRSLKISGSAYHRFRKPEILKAGFAAGLDFAFEMLNVQRVEAEVLASNGPAQHYEIDYLGFKVEGVKRKAVYKCGRYYDSLVLGMLREEWESCPRVVAYGGTCNTMFSHEIAESFILDRNLASEVR